MEGDWFDPSDETIDEFLSDSDRGGELVYQDEDLLVTRIPHSGYDESLVFNYLDIGYVAVDRFQDFDREGHPDTWSIESVALKHEYRGTGASYDMYDHIQDYAPFNLYQAIGESHSFTPAGKAFAIRWLSHRLALEEDRASGLVGLTESIVWTAQLALEAVRNAPVVANGVGSPDGETLDEVFKEWAHNNMSGKKGFQSTRTAIEGEPGPITSLSGGGAGTLKTPWLVEPVKDVTSGGRFADTKAKGQGMGLERYADSAVAERMRADPAVIDAIVAMGPGEYGSFGITYEALGIAREGSYARTTARTKELYPEDTRYMNAEQTKRWQAATAQASRENGQAIWDSLSKAERRDYVTNGIPDRQDLATRQKEYQQRVDSGFYTKYPQYDQGMPTDIKRRDVIGGFGIVHNLGQAWYNTSGNGRSIAIQLAARDEFGLTGHMSRFKSAPDAKLGFDEYARSGKLLRLYVRHMYENTQAEFAAAGITHVNVARGLRDVTSRGTTRLTSQPVSSWTASKTVAKKFGSSIAYTRFPVSWVLSTPRTGMGILPELEVTILGRRSYYGHVTDNPGYVFQPGMPEGPSPEVG